MRRRGTTTIAERGAVRQQVRLGRRAGEAAGGEQLAHRAARGLGAERLAELDAGDRRRDLPAVALRGDIDADDWLADELSEGERLAERRHVGGLGAGFARGHGPCRWLDRVEAGLTWLA